MEAFRFRFFTVLVKIIILIDELKVFVITIFGIPLFLLTLAAMFPVFQADATIGICRICGATKTDSVVRYLDFPIKYNQRFQHRSIVKHYYDLLIATTHVHEWCRGYEIRKSGTLFGWNSVNRTMWKNDEYPIYQPRLTHMALSMAIYLRYSKKSFRHDLFYEMINSHAKDEYYDLCIQYDKRKSRRSKSARLTWKEWLRRRQGRLKKELTKSPIPAWAYRSIDSIPSTHQDLQPEDAGAVDDFGRAWFVSGDGGNFRK